MFKVCLKNKRDDDDDYDDDGHMPCLQSICRLHQMP